MQIRLVAAATLCASLLVPQMALAQEKDGCASQWQGQRLADSLYNIDLMMKLLAHLKGCEDPKAKRLIESNLQWAAANARASIEQGAGLASPYFAVNFVRPVHEAALYASEHSLEKAPVAQGKEPQPEIGKNLEVVERWLEKHR